MSQVGEAGAGNGAAYAGPLRPGADSRRASTLSS